MRSTGKADWEVIKKVKESVNIPVIGNGDIDSPEKALEMMEYSNVDGIMIGRAAIGNPWIFKRVIEYLKTGTIIPEVPVSEKIDIAIKHMDNLIEEIGEQKAIREMRGHAVHYVKGIKYATNYKVEIQSANTKEDMIKVFEKIRKEEN